MWHWDQGRLEYFQIDSLRKVAQFILANDLKVASKEQLRSATGLPFAAPDTHSVWRNYSRIFKLTLLVSVKNNKAVPTPVANILASPGIVTCDEYLHFIASVFTEPSPALQDWAPQAPKRYPLLFTLKYLLAKIVVKEIATSSFDEIMGAYSNSGFIGNEDQTDFISIFDVPLDQYENESRNGNSALRRQARESMLVLAQISYLSVYKDEMVVSLDKEDAAKIFDDLSAINGNPSADRDSEIYRLAELFKGGSIYNEFEYNSTKINEALESGFLEGGRIKRTHITIERNTGIRRSYFELTPTSTCDLCGLNTSNVYPWADRIIDLHHLLPLASGTRVKVSGTTFDDLVPVCPTCHRAIHRFYEKWLLRYNKKDFADRDEAKAVYQEVRSMFRGVAGVS